MKFIVALLFLVPIPLAPDQTNAMWAFHLPKIVTKTYHYPLATVKKIEIEGFFYNCKTCDRLY